MPYAGAHKKEGPAAVKYTFETVGKIWVNEHFEILAIFGDEHEEGGAGQPVNVAVFGKFTYKSTVLGKRYTSPFSFWCQVGLQAGQIVHMQFMEDTVGSVISAARALLTYSVRNGGRVRKGRPKDVRGGRWAGIRNWHGPGLCERGPVMLCVRAAPTSKCKAAEATKLGRSHREMAGKWVRRAEKYIPHVSHDCPHLVRHGWHRPVGTQLLITIASARSA